MHDKKYLHKLISVYPYVFIVFFMIKVSHMVTHGHTHAHTADGLALGAAAGLSKADVEFVIFLAIMLHKAPAAFGFTSFLIHEVRI